MAEEFIFQLNITGPDGFSQVFRVPVGITQIGRQAGNDLRLVHSQISRQHAQIDCTTTECRITDLGSSNGTRLHDEKLTPHVPVLLTSSSVVNIGPYALSLEKTPVETFQEKELPPAEETPVKLGAVEVREIPPTPEPVLPSLESEPSPEIIKRAVETPSLGAPPTEPPQPPSAPPAAYYPGDGIVPPGLSTHSTRLLNFLPGIYHTDFMSRFLALFESILIPIEWNVDNFDLFLDPGTTTRDFLPWLANWFALTFDSTWSDAQRRTLLKEAYRIYARRGTRGALSRILEIYTGRKPEIIDTGDDLKPFTFTVRLPLRQQEVNQELVEALIDANKPAHSTYSLEFS